MARYYGVIMSRKPGLAFGLLIAMVMLLAPALGCGDDAEGDGATNGNTTSTITDDGLDRSQPGRVSITDETGEKASSGDATAMLPSWLDISLVSIASGDGNLVFETTLTEPVPQTKPEVAIGVEWGFIIDTDSNGEPDYGLYAAYQTDTLTYGLFNPLGGERQADGEFPGSFTISGNTLSWTLQTDAIGQPESFQWVAYSDAAADSGGEQSHVVKSGDKVPSDGWPGAGWLPFP